MATNTSTFNEPIADTIFLQHVLRFNDRKFIVHEAIKCKCATAQHTVTVCFEHFLFGFRFFFWFRHAVSDANVQWFLSAMVIGSILFVIIATLYIRQFRLVLQSTPPQHLARTLTLCGVYTIVGAASLTSLCVFRANVLCDAICHFTFVMGAYQFFCLCIDYAGGESNFIKRTGGLLSFNLQTPPLCCCLTFLQPAAMTKYVVCCRCECGGATI